MDTLGLRFPYYRLGEIVQQIALFGTRNGVLNTEVSSQGKIPLYWGHLKCVFYKEVLAMVSSSQKVLSNVRIFMYVHMC